MLNLSSPNETFQTQFLILRMSFLTLHCSCHSSPNVHVSFCARRCQLFNYSCNVFSIYIFNRRVSFPDFHFQTQLLYSICIFHSARVIYRLSFAAATLSFKFHARMCACHSQLLILSCHPLTQPSFSCCTCQFRFLIPNYVFSTPTWICRSANYIFRFHFQLQFLHPKMHASPGACHPLLFFPLQFSSTKQHFICPCHSQLRIFICHTNHPSSIFILRVFFLSLSFSAATF